MKNPKSHLVCTLFLVMLVAYGLVPTGQAQTSKPKDGASEQGAAAPTAAELEERMRKRLKDQAAEFWIYDDVESGYALAKESGKPLLVSFRCVP